MKLFGGLFNWATGERVECFSCGTPIKDNDPTNVVIIESSSGKAEYNICPTCAEVIDQKAVGE